MGNAMKEDQASQAGEVQALANAMAAEMVAARNLDRLWHGFATIFNVAALVLYVNAWPGLAGLCIWVSILISVARMVRE